MARQLKPCGTVAAYQRHRRRGEDPCEECKNANRLKSVEPKALRDVPAEAVEDDGSDLDQLAELRFMYRRIRAALGVAEPKEVATLAKQGDAILERITRVSEQSSGGDSRPVGDELDQFRQSREERRAAR